MPVEVHQVRPEGGVLVSSEDTGGAFALLEYALEPSILLAPVHTHSREDEFTYVVGGMLGAQIGDEVVVVPAGQLLCKRRGVPHTVWNASSDAPVRVLELIVPGGFERMFGEAAHAVRTSGEERRRALWENEELWARYGIEMDPASIPGLLARHGLKTL